MNAVLGRMRALGGIVASVALLLFGHGGVAGANRARIIDRHGRQIPSVYNGVSPNLRYAHAFAQMMRTGGTNPRSCSDVHAAIYRESDHVGRLLKVQGGCGAHYQVEEIRPCGSCLGGSENWTYSDVTIATWCDGYIIDQMGCNGSCREDTYCDSCQ